MYLLKVKNRSTRTGCEIFGSSSKIVEKNWLLLGNRNIYCLLFSNTSKTVFSERDYVFEYSHYSFDLCEYIYGIHHWRILWSSYRKLVWVRFEPTTTEFRSGARTDSYQAMNSTRTQSQLCTATPISTFVQHFISEVCLRPLPRLF